MDWEPAGKQGNAGSSNGMSQLPKKKKKLPIIIAVIVILAIIGGISSRVSSCSKKAEEESRTFTWPTSGLATELPEPSIKTGEIKTNSDTSFWAELTKVSKSDYDDYVTSIKDAEYTDISGEGTDYFSATAPSGAKLSLDFDSGERTMGITLRKQDDSATADSSTEDTATDDTAAQSTETTATDAAATDNGGVSADFKQTMDDYESFMNQYCDFMEKYQSSDDTTSMLVDYAKMTASYTEWAAKWDAIDESTLSAADDAYYLEVQGRVAARLAQVAQ